MMQKFDQNVCTLYLFIVIFRLFLGRPNSLNDLASFASAPLRLNLEEPKDQRQYDPSRILIDDLSSSQLADFAVSTAALGLDNSTFLVRRTSLSE